MLKPTVNSQEISHFGKCHIQCVSHYFISQLCVTKPNFEQFCLKYSEDVNQRNAQNHRQKKIWCQISVVSFGFHVHIYLCYSEIKHKTNLSQSLVLWRIICYNFLNPFAIAFVIGMLVQQNPPTMLPCNAAKSSKSAGPRINCPPLEVNGRTACIVSSVCVKRIFRKSTINNVLKSAIQKMLVQH